MKWISYSMISDQHLPQEKIMLKVYGTTQDNLRRGRFASFQFSKNIHFEISHTET